VGLTTASESLAKLTRLLPKGIHPLTLEFKNRDLEERFQVDYINRSLLIIRISMMAGGLQYLLFFLLDFMIEQLPDAVSLIHLLIIRLAVFLVIAFITALSFQDYFKRYFQFSVSLVPIIAGIGVCNQSGN
jgi:hypothetical protein